MKKEFLSKNGKDDLIKQWHHIPGWKDSVLQTVIFLRIINSVHTVVSKCHFSLPNQRYRGGSVQDEPGDLVLLMCFTSLLLWNKPPPNLGALN